MPATSLSERPQHLVAWSGHVLTNLSPLQFRVCFQQVRRTSDRRHGQAQSPSYRYPNHWVIITRPVKLFREQFDLAPDGRGLVAAHDGVRLRSRRGIRRAARRPGARGTRCSRCTARVDHRASASGGASRLGRRADGNPNSGRERWMRTLPRGGWSSS